MEKPHKQLVAWQVAMEAVLLVYRASERFPPEERYGLKEQVRLSGLIRAQRKRPSRLPPHDSRL
ncbi:MAG: four helix bundle protein [Nitrospira sp.]|nr:four helix bundle protein [Nitrospira sp.]